MCGASSLRAVVWPNRPRRSLSQNESGASAVEFAIVMPVFLLFMVSIIGYGMYIGASHSVAQLAADAARAAVAGLSDQERTDIARAVVISSASNYPLLAGADVQVEAGPAPSDASEFRVNVRYDASSLPIWLFGDLIPLPSRTIEHAAVIRRGGY